MSGVEAAALVDPVAGRGVAGVSRGVGGAGRVLPVAGPLAELLPYGGLRRGATASVTASVGLLVGLLAGASASGAWCAVAGLPQLGLLACDEAGVDLGRLVLAPGTDWPTAATALLDGCDLVAVAAASVTAQAARRLSLRARHRGAVLVGFGCAWPGSEVVLTPTESRWHGLGAGEGRLRHREVT
ncbi:MAG: hypothetical protein ACRDXX_06525, partial [Stackebrandtia sp.]